MKQSILVELATRSPTPSLQCLKGSRMNEKSKQRIDADNAFLRTQTQSMVRERILSESDTSAQARDTNTARLRELRLQKETQEREAAAAILSKARKDRKPD